MPGRAITRWRSLGALCLGLGTAWLSACSSSSDVGGVWQGTSPARGIGNQVVYASDGQALGLKLVIGQYGPDLAGILRFYTSAAFDRERSADSPDFECACAYLHGGRMDPVSGKVTFVLQGCMPGSASQQKQRVRGVFSLQTGGHLGGTLRIDDPASALSGQSVDLQFDRLAQSGDIDPSDLVCSQPVDAAHGNPFNGL